MVFKQQPNYLMSEYLSVFPTEAKKKKKTYTFLDKIHEKQKKKKEKKKNWLKMVLCNMK